MNIDACNAKMLSNTMPRGAYIRELRDKYAQPIIAYPKTGAREWRDIPYGPHKKNKLDIYLPPGEGPFPVIFFVHGGGWFMGDKSDFGVSLAFPYLFHNYALVSIGYRLADEAIFPAPVQDICDGIDFIKEHAQEYAIDISKMGIQSGSAGSILAAHAALLGKGIKAAMLRCAILDFKNITAQFQAIGLKRERFAPPESDLSIEALFMGGTPLELPDAYEACNPKNHIKEDCPFFYLQHGMADIDTPYLQSVDFVQAVQAVCGADRAQIYLMPNTGHDNGMYDYAYAFLSQLQFFDRHLLCAGGN